MNSSHFLLHEFAEALDLVDRIAHIEGDIRFLTARTDVMVQLLVLAFVGVFGAVAAFIWDKAKKA